MPTIKLPLCRPPQPLPPVDVVMEMAFEGTEPVLKPLVDSDEAPSNEQEADRIGEAASKNSLQLQSCSPSCRLQSFCASLLSFCTADDSDAEASLLSVLPEEVKLAVLQCVEDRAAAATAAGLSALANKRQRCVPPPPLHIIMRKHFSALANHPLLAKRTARSERLTVLQGANRGRNGPRP